MAGVLVDARGKRCPLPIIELAKAIQLIEVGERLTLLSDDPATHSDITAWSRMTKNVVERIEECEFVVTRLV